jgi:hypothetical protein
VGDKIEKNNVGWHVARRREGRGMYGVLVGKPEGKRLLRRPRRRGRVILRWIFKK